MADSCKGVNKISRDFLTVRGTFASRERLWSKGSVIFLFPFVLQLLGALLLFMQAYADLVEISPYL